MATLGSQMECWICGADADSGEHRVKASDMRRFFGKITPASPVFFHSDDRRNIRIHSAKSDKLKTSKVICQRCNDTHTAKYDDAWTLLSRSILAGWENVKKTKRFKLQTAFPGKVGQQSINFHLYFVKLFGCRIADENMPIDLSHFAKCVLEQHPHSGIYLSFNMRNIHSKSGLYVGISEVHGKEYGGVCEAATWYYSLGELDVQVSWSKETPIRNVPYAWHPESGGKIIKFRQR
ncbi:MAG TPA: hypothetical protein VIM41_06435 [Gammaproteobacteria bacterium]